MQKVDSVVDEYNNIKLWKAAYKIIQTIKIIKIDVKYSENNFCSKFKLESHEKVGYWTPDIFSYHKAPSNGYICDRFAKVQAIVRMIILILTFRNHARYYIGL